uniref:dihydrofolate reductase n=1 Tax=Mesocestoides corti TaxID=53468 RepID=A0A5K3F7B2_MESCO
MTLKRLNVIAAVASNGGIGKANKLPWKIREDMDFFTRITTTAQEGRRNAVILGRNTWASIPPKFRPLPNRINVIVSTQLESVNEGVYLARSFDDSIRLVESLHDDGLVDEVFVIGGSRIYEVFFLIPRTLRLVPCTQLVSSRPILNLQSSLDLKIRM